MRVNLFILLVFFSLSALFPACQSKKDKTYERIIAMQDSLYNQTTGMVNADIAEKLLDDCMRYAEAYPEDTAAAVFMLKAKDYALYVNDPMRSVQIMEQFMQKYPNHEQSGSLVFALAFVYENYLGDMNKARENYELFLKDYPNQGKLTEDARFALNNLGKTAEEIMMGFDSTATEPPTELPAP
jgi:outer membrane protein assembly factor BamD (BamD/ComL family)